MNSEFFAKYKTPILVVVGLLVLAGIFSAGRYSAPEQVREVTKVEFQEKIVTVEKQVVVTQDRIVYVEKKKSDVHTETTTTVNPDGSSSTHTVTVDKTITDTASSQETLVADVKEKTTDADIKKNSETETVISNSRPQWQLGARVEGGVLLTRPIQPILGIGIQAQRRILGPLFMGVSVSGDFGLNMAGVTGPYSVKAGFITTLEF